MCICKLNKNVNYMDTCKEESVTYIKVIFLDTYGVINCQNKSVLKPVVLVQTNTCKVKIKGVCEENQLILYTQMICFIKI